MQFLLSLIHQFILAIHFPIFCSRLPLVIHEFLKPQNPKNHGLHHEEKKLGKSLSSFYFSYFSMQFCLVSLLSLDRPLLHSRSHKLLHLFHASNTIYSTNHDHGRAIYGGQTLQIATYMPKNNVFDHCCLIPFISTCCLAYMMLNLTYMMSYLSQSIIIAKHKCPLGQALKWLKQGPIYLVHFALYFKIVSMLFYVECLYIVLFVLFWVVDTKSYLGYLSTQIKSRAIVLVVPLESCLYVVLVSSFEKGESFSL